MSYGKEWLTMPLYLMDLLLLYILSLSSVSMVLLVFSEFKSVYALLLGTAVFLIIVKAFNKKLEFRDNRFGWGLLLILLLALFFRHDTYLWTQGGQDQGLYVSLSAHMDRAGGLRGVDGLREKLDADQKKLYDHYNSFSKNGSLQRHAGVAVTDAEKSTYTFPWYPLHPVWMAICAELFGYDNRVYSVVLFSLLSIISFYLLALELSGGDRFPAYLAALFLAVNPLHVFFSKFPTTEMLTLAFSSSAFYCLLRYYRNAGNEKPDPFYLIMSAGLICCLSFVRITLFLYLPVFYLASFLTIVFVDEGAIKRQLLLYFCSILLIFAISSFFYQAYMPDLSYIVMWPWSLFLMITAAIGSLIPTHFLSKSGRLQDALGKLARHKRMVLLLIFIGVLLAAIKHVEAFSVLHNIHGLRLAGSLPLSWYVLYLSPVGFLVFAFSFYFLWRQWNSNVLLLFLIVSTSCFYLIELPHVINGVPYQYYHARFLLPEVIPYSLLVISLYLGSMKKKKLLVYPAVLLMLSFFLFFSFYLVNGKEEPDRSFLTEISDQVKEKDLLLIRAADKKANASYFTTPLVYYRNLNVFVLPEVLDLYKDENRDLWEKFSNFYLLSSEALPESSALRYIKKIKYTVRYMRIDSPDLKRPFANACLLFRSLLPTKQIEDERCYYLYKMLNVPVIAERPTALPEVNPITSKHFFIKDAMTNPDNVWDDGWTSGDVVIRSLQIKVDRMVDRYVILDISAFPPAGDTYDKCKIDLYANKAKLEYSHQKGRLFYFRLGKALQVINELNITSCTFVPKELGWSGDDRKLGVGIASVRIGRE